MKSFLKSLSFIIFLSWIITGCKKDENKIFLQGGTAPQLSASVSNTIPLSFANQDANALTLKWTNPNYMFNNGVSSLDVTYNIEIDTAGANFTSPKKKVISVSTDLSRSLTQKELNIILLNDMELTIGTTYNLAIRVISTLSTIGAAPLVSNILSLQVTPYQDPTLLPPDLYITGDATAGGWTNSPPVDQKFTYIGSKKYELTIAFAPGFAYKFLTVLGQWQPQYGSASSSGGALQVNDGTPGSSDPPAISTPATAGNYKITVDLGAMTYSIVKL